MITFWLTVAVLIVVLVVAVLFVLPPLLRNILKKSPVSPSSKVATILGGRNAAITVFIAIPALAVVLYFVRPQSQTVPTSPIPATQKEKMAPEHALVIEDMAARLEQNPEDGNGWAMLGNAYAVMGRYADAVIAYEKAIKLIPDDARLLVDYADVMAVANDRNLRGKPMELINKALKIDPDNVKGLALIGTAAFQAEDYRSSVKYWEKLLKLLPPDSPFALQMTSGVAEARAMIAGKKTPSFGPAEDKAQPAAVAGQISGVLTLSPALADKAAPTDSIFLSAKDISGSPIPVAVMRAEVKDLPLKFTLDDTMMMVPGAKLSDYKEVMISVKISKSGEAITQSGDLKGDVASVKVGAKNVRVVIDQVAK